MIPVTDLLETETEETEATKQHKLVINEIREQILGECENLEALKQAVYKILNTERYTYPVYSWNYGIQTVDLIGEDMEFVKSEIKRRIEEALLRDRRITEVTDFEFTESRNSLIIKLNVSSIYGNFNTEMGVYNV